MVYVTHDQAEAMVTADRIAIMNLGRIEQVGTPYEIYETPRTAFAASFIGRMNVLEGTLAHDGAVACGPVSFRALQASSWHPAPKPSCAFARSTSFSVEWRERRTDEPRARPHRTPNVSRRHPRLSDRTLRRRSDSCGTDPRSIIRSARK